MSWLKAPNNSAATTSKINAQQLRVSMADFEWALTTVHPSAKREGFATVPDVSWEDIGSLQAVRTELNWSILVGGLLKK
jgi:ribosome biogenesis ATPase